MTTREELRSRGFDFFCFTSAEDRTAFREKYTEDCEVAEVDEVHCRQEFHLYFLGVKRLHHTPVKFTPVGG